MQRAAAQLASIEGSQQQQQPQPGGATAHNQAGEQQVNFSGAHLSEGPKEATSGGGGGCGSISSTVDIREASPADWPANGPSRQINSGIEQTTTSERPASASHRIKVTLSLPRSSTGSEPDRETISVTAESATTTAPDSSDERQQQQQHHSLPDPRRRQSTATLISAAESQSSLLRRPTRAASGGGSSSGQRAPSSAGSSLRSSASSLRLGSFATGTGHLGPALLSGAAASRAPDRAVQERELRRIASQRAAHSRPTQAAQLEASPIGAQSASGAAAPIEPAASKKNQQQQQQLDVVPNPKQLAIYINGKIRSNSIFCQSASLSDSFHSILNRFTNGNSNSSSPAQGSKNDRPTQEDSRLAELQGERNRASKSDRQHRSLVGPNEQLADSDSETNNERLAPAKGTTQLGLRVGRLIGRYLPNALVCENTQRQQGDNGSDSGSSSYADRTGEVQEKKPFRCEDLSGISGTSRKQLTTSYKLNPSSMFLRKAMRYYRLWIYCTNFTILLGTLLFIVAVLYVASDYRIPLIINDSGSRLQSSAISIRDQNDDADDDYSEGSPHLDDDGIDQHQVRIFTLRVVRNFPISFTEPSMLFAYVAVAIQAGILQLIGCFGAIRMREKFIQLFWYMILALTLLDVLFLAYWLLRYDLMSKSLDEHMKYRLNEHFGDTNSSGRPIPALGEDTKFDKIFANIINRIQSESRCCGIASPLDYRGTKWRQVKVGELEKRLNWSRAVEPHGSLLARVPLVPASCCRRRQLAPPSGIGRQEEEAKRKRPVILDDSEAGQKVRVPAWAPSSVTEDLQQRGSSGQHRVRLRQQTGPSKGSEDQDRAELGDIIDERWTHLHSNGAGHSSVGPSGGGSSGAGNDDTDDDDDTENEDGDGHKEQDWRLSKQQKRLLAKQDNYNRAKLQPPPPSRDRRWLVESSLDGQQRVLSRLVEVEPDAAGRPPEDYEPTTTNGPRDRADGNNIEQQVTNSLASNEVTPLSRLANLRRVLFLDREKLPSILRPTDRQHDDDDGPDIGQQPSSSNDTTGSSWPENATSRFRWPNKLQLNYGQYKMLESYLLAEEETRLAGQRAPPSRSPRSIFSSLVPGAAEPTASSSAGPQNASPTPKEGAPESKQASRPQAEQLRLALQQDQGLACAPRSHFDAATIYTSGCHEPIRAWLDRSGHILFVTGFCVLSMLKLFSLLLLRLELREMIHKIRVLKGMATEYNALHDLEAYLPRPSLCAQAAELTPTGVAAAILPAASATPVPGAATGQPPGRIGGGSFSEAVAAATAAAAAATNPRQLSAGPIGGPCRASSMKTVTGGMLAPSMCPRSSSASAAHLQQRCGPACSLRSDPFHQSGCGGGTMSRRHTAISVCPAAAAAAAAAAAHHLMSRRGTYVPSAFPLVSPSLGFNLSQHRHSAHTVHALPNAGNQSNMMMMLLNTSSGKHQHQQQQQQRRPSSTSSAQQHRTSLAVAPNVRHYLGDMARNARDEAQSSMDSNQSGGRQLLSTASGASGPACQREPTNAIEQQQLLYPTFKRQSSTGAQSACNFSLDPRPAASLLAESRRSIH